MLVIPLQGCSMLFPDKVIEDHPYANKSLTAVKGIALDVYQHDSIKPKIAKLLEVNGPFLFVSFDKSFGLQNNLLDLPSTLKVAPGGALVVDRVILSKDFFTSSQYYFRFKNPSPSTEHPYIYGSEDLECDEPLYLSSCFRQIHLIVK